jgi:hypothetical protein
MAWNAMLLSAAVLATPLPSDTSRSTPATYRYAVSCPQFGAIGTYVHSTDDSNGVDRAQSRLDIIVRVLGIPVYREQSDESEAWRDGRLISFESHSTINAKPLLVHGELRDGRLAVTTPGGMTIAPAGTMAADPWSSRQLGPATVVTIKTGEIMRINTTGGETEKVVVNGAPTLTRHFHVSTPTQLNRWEIWLDPGGVPVKFRSIEHGRSIDFMLMNAPNAAYAKRVASER